jgi:predicted transcriptional regulator
VAGTFTLRIPDDLRAQLEQVAARERRSLAQVIVLRLEASLNGHDLAAEARPLSREEQAKGKR